MLCTDPHWDYGGVRGILAVVLQALVAQTGRRPEDVSLEQLLEHRKQATATYGSWPSPSPGTDSTLTLTYDILAALGKPVPPSGYRPLDTGPPGRSPPPGSLRPVPPASVVMGWAVTAASVHRGSVRRRAGCRRE
ncbi:hypothetical protein ACIQ9Q_25630 [Streptomyces sp. NPDC094438]|uniref:hypothetical protein n=1 Tax=Streptomyces sp. NPDC094438 TaxID=3366061 RepID=UPI0037F88470